MGATGGAIGQLSAALDAVAADASFELVGDDDLLAEIRELERQRCRIEAVAHQRLPELDRRRTAIERGCRDTATLLVELLRITPGEARARMRDAANLGIRVGFSGLVAAPLFPGIAALHRDGRISTQHVRVVTRCVERLPEAVQDERGAEVEQTLAQACQQFAPDKVRALGRLIEACLNPDGVYADDREQEARREVRLHPLADGSGRLEGRLTGDTLAIWQAVLDVLAAPAPADDMPDQRSAAQRAHDGLRTAGQLLLRAGLLPDCGGVVAAVQVTLTADQVLAAAREVGSTAQPDRRPPAPLVRTGHGSTLTLQQAGSLLAEADVLPVWLSDAGGVTALGRSRRTASAAQRRALAARDRGCSFPGCDVPPSWCETHHVREWALGGATDLDNLTLLCGHHHREFARRGWRVQLERGRPEWIAPRWIDPDQRPRTNTAHHIDQLMPPVWVDDTVEQLQPQGVSAGSGPAPP